MGRNLRIAFALLSSFRTAAVESAFLFLRSTAQRPPYIIIPQLSGKGSLRTHSITIVAALALSASCLYAQTGVESNLPGAGFDQPIPPTIHVYSRETVIDVLATDDKGQPVTGLTRADFTIEEDGHPQPIRSFREYSVTKTPPPRILPPHTYTNAQALPASGPVQIFLFDTADSPTVSIVRSRKYIADYFRTMPAGTEVAIFNLSPTKGLMLLQGFTSDGQLAASAIDQHFDAEWDVFQGQRIDDAAKIAALEQLAAYVAGIHGRKNFIWVVPGMPFLIDRDGGYTDPCASVPPDMTKVHRLMDLYDKFTQEEIAIYPFDPLGVHSLLCGALRAQQVADETGGSTDNTNDYKGEAAKIVDSTSHFYTLSYVPTRPDSDGHFHPITIKVNRPGVHLSYRTGYNDEQPQPPDPVLKQRMIQGPMRLGALPTTQLLFDLEVQPTPPSNSAAYTAAEAALKSAGNSDKKVPAKALKGSPYDVVFRFDPTQIGFSEDPNGTRTANLEFDLGAYDLYSNLLVARSQVIKLALTPAEYDEFMKTPFRFYLPIPLPKGQLTLRAGLFDTVANTSGSFQLPLAVPKK
jgi:VWFA-related protein